MWVVARDGIEPPTPAFSGLSDQPLTEHALVFSKRYGRPIWTPVGRQEPSLDYWTPRGLQAVTITWTPTSRRFGISRASRGRRVWDFCTLRCRPGRQLFFSYIGRSCPVLPDGLEATDVNPAITCAFAPNRLQCLLPCTRAVESR
jgi:hypothetical protein